MPRDTTNSAFKPLTLIDRLLIKEGLGGKSFMQKSKGSFNSNLEIPGYQSPTMNGKGYTFNAVPNER